MKEFDMDKEYAREFRAFKAEIEDRVKRLEGAQSAADAQPAAPSASVTSPKKSAAEAASPDKDAG